MKLWVGVTDDDWFTQLSRLRPDEVNFWQPSGSRTFRALEPGELFLFKLHSPKNSIVGGGHFVRYASLPASLAWDALPREERCDLSRGAAGANPAPPSNDYSADVRADGRPATGGP
jgi:hypothetical protein